MDDSGKTAGAKKARVTRFLYWQILFTALAFALVVVLSGLYVSNILRSHLKRDVEAVLAETILKIEDSLTETETALNIISMTTRSMILRGDGADTVLEYMKDIFAGLQKKQRGFKPDSIYGYFDVFGGAFLHSKNWSGEGNYNPIERPWYRVAVAAGNKLAVTPIYWDLQVDGYCITYVHRIFNETGQPLGVVCLNVPVSSIVNDVAEMSLTKGSYGVLHDEYLNIYYHPNPSVIGQNGRDVGGGIAALGSKVLSGIVLSEYESTNLAGILTVTFSSRLKNGWFLFFILPKAEYYREVRDMALFFGILGLFLTAGLIIALIRIDVARQKTVGHTP